jgi:aspartate/tyrosine/aromatic aminotransferase
MFASLSPAPADPILGLTDAFKADPNPQKINLGVGVFKDDAGRTPILSSVKKAETRLLASETTKSYLPISGSPGYAAGVQRLLLGEGHDLIASGRIQTAHTPGGTGGLRVAGDFLKFLRPEATVRVSNPTWANHKGVFAACGFPVSEYPYYNPVTQGLDFDAMLQALKSVPAGDIVLLHVCCHNPSGVDPTPEQWAQIADVAAEKEWFPLFDFAYQGFGTSVEDDRAPLLLFAGKGLEFAVAASCSKNFGLYNERTGSFSLVAGTADDAATAFSHVKRIIRTNYSNPSSHGGAIVETILSDADLTREWREELDGMRDRIQVLRRQFVETLAAKGADRDFSFISRQNGMFSFSGLSPEQVTALRDRHSIYIVGSGRINVAGITSDNLDRLCEAVVSVL